MLDLRRLRLLRELAERGTIAAVADALQYTPSAVSQQLAMLEREAGVPLLEGAALAEADRAAAAGTVAGRGRIAGFQSVTLRLAIPAMAALARDAPRLRCELVEAEPEQALPALALGDVDLVLADEWQHQPHSRPPGVDRHDLHRDPVRLVLSEDHPAARAHPRSVPLADLAGEHWTTGHRDTGWEEIVGRTCRELGGFDPDIRHRSNDSVLSLAAVASGLAVTLLPELVRSEAH